MKTITLTDEQFDTLFEYLDGKVESIVENLSELGWDYSCGRMSRSGMEIYDGIMRHCGILDKTEHWNEDVYADANGDW